jgi:hypothetical protein
VNAICALLLTHHALQTLYSQRSRVYLFQSAICDQALLATLSRLECGGCDHVYLAQSAICDQALLATLSHFCVNVKGLTEPRNKRSLEDIIYNLKRCGYEVKFQVLNSSDFDLPQDRDRLFIVGIINDIEKGCRERLSAFTRPKRCTIW